MRISTIVRALDYLVEAGWLLALVAVPFFFDTMTVRIFEPDKIVLFRNIVLVMAVAALARLALSAPAAMARSAQARAPRETAEGEPVRSAQSWWRRELALRPIVVPVIIFAIIYALATARSVLPWISFWGSFDRLQGLYTWLSYITFFFIAAYSLRTWAQIERIVNAIVFMSVPVAIYGIMQHMQWDPVQWGADTSVRVASTLGNSIFLGAYLIMCMPFAAYRLWRAVERWRYPEQNRITAGSQSTKLEIGEDGELHPKRAPKRSAVSNRQKSRQHQKDTIEITGIPPVLSVIGYALVLLICFAALYYTGSRGPYYGFAAATLVIGFPLTMRFRNPYPAMGSIALFILLIGFPQAVSKLSPGVALVLFLIALVVLVLQLARKLLRPSQALAALGIAFLVMVFTFPQAINVLNPPPSTAAAASSGTAGSNTAADAQHLTDFSDTGTSQVRLYIWKGSLGLIKERPILGWGPETMIYVYSKYYPPGLGHIERANAAPDRNHDEEMDFLVFSGVLGLLAWLAILCTFAFMIIRVLLRAQSRRAILLAATTGAVVVGHFVEGLVGIGIVSTLMLLWTMFALATVLYARRDLLAEASALTPEASAAAAGIVRGAASGTKRPARGRETRPAPSAPSIEHLRPGQQGLLAGLVIVWLIALVVSILLFGNNVQVVRADAAYKQAQGWEAAANACFTRLQNPNDPAGLQCPVATGTTQQQVLQLTGTRIIPTALSYMQEAIGEQPHQDMYYLWLGKVYLDEARYYVAAKQPDQARAQYQLAESTLLDARKLNPYNADHPMNLARMYTTWAETLGDPSKWALANKYYAIATGPTMAHHNGRWIDEWGRSELQHAQQAGLTPAQRTQIYRNALAHFKQAAKADDLLGDARVYEGDTYMYLNMPAQAAAAYEEALKVGGFEQFAAAQPGQVSPSVVQRLVTALNAAHEYAALVHPIYVGGSKAPLYGGASPMTLAYSPTVGLMNTPFSTTLQAISTTLRQKGYIK